MQTISIHGRTLSFHRQGQGLPLVLVHGFPLDSASWAPLLSLLENQFDVLVPDLRGFGDSDAGVGGYGMDDLADDLAALLDACGLPKAFVAGHSMGGYVALAFARLFPQRLLGLGLVASQAAADPPERKIARYETAALAREQGSLAVLGMAEKLSASAIHAAFFRQIIQRQGVDGISNALAAMAERPDSLETIASLPVPLALIHGDADALIPVDRCREMKQANPAAVLVELPGVGHSPALEAPQQTAETLAAVFAGK